MRYLISARVRPKRQAELLEALESGRFGAGFPYGDLGETLATGRIDASGTIRWVEVCYCREFNGVAMDEELPYFEEFLTDITITDARSPRHCKGYPACSTCDCTAKVRPKGTAFLERLRDEVHLSEPAADPTLDEGSPTRWLGWRGEVTPEEDRRNRSGADRLDKSKGLLEIDKS